MKRRGLLRMLVASSAVGTGVGIGTSTNSLVQPVRAQSGSGLYQEAKLAANDGESGDWFGALSVSGDGTTALVGARRDDNSNGAGAGAAYVFTYNDGEWSQQQKLSPGDGDKEDKFGVRTSLSDDGNTALIGAKWDNDPNGNNAGSAYVFTRENGEWTQQQKLVADDGGSTDEFGGSVSLTSDGTTALIGARYHAGLGPGAAYVFTLNEGEWTQQEKLVADDGDSRDNFGISVSLSSDGGTALIGAQNDGDPNGEEAGSAYVFTRNSSGWSQQEKLAAEDGNSGDIFGSSVSLSGDGSTALIGASRDGPNDESLGAAYVFVRNTGNWAQQQKLTPDDGESWDRFGTRLSMSSDGTTALIDGHTDDNSNGDDAGAAYVFTEDDGAWSQQQKLIPDDGDSGDKFGLGVSISNDGGIALAGARKDEDPNGDAAGSAYVFSQRVHIDNPSLEPPTIEGQQSSHTLSFIVQNVSSEGSGDEFDDEFEVTFPEEVVLEGYSNVDIDAQFSAVEQSGNTLTFSVSPVGGGTTQISVEMDVTLSPANSQ